MGEIQADGGFQDGLAGLQLAFRAQPAGSLADEEIQADEGQEHHEDQEHGHGCTSGEGSGAGPGVAAARGM